MAQLLNSCIEGDPGGRHYRGAAHCHHGGAGHRRAAGAGADPGADPGADAADPGPTRGPQGATPSPLHPRGQEGNSSLAQSDR